MPEYQEKSIVRANEQLADTVFRLTLHAPAIATNAQPGQFVMASANGGTCDPLLRRPFSLHQCSDQGDVQLLFKVIGRGTLFLSSLRPGQELNLIGPLGRGFRLPVTDPVCLIGGGMGIAPLLFLATRLMQRTPLAVPPIALLGSRSADEINTLVADFSACGCQVYPATEDGSLGHHGYISELLPQFLPVVKRVCVCGPSALMATVAQLSKAASIPCEASLETHMACGLGACLGCTIHAADGTYRHVCKHGPVFKAEEIAWTR